MGRLILRPNGAGTLAQHTRVGGGTANWQAIDEVVRDDLTTYLRNKTTLDGGVPQVMSDNFQLEDPPGGLTGGINWVELHCLAILESAGDPAECTAQLTPQLRIAPTTYSGTPWEFIDSIFEWIEAVHRWTTNPAGGSWTWAALTGLQGAFTTVCMDDGFVEVELDTTQVWLLVDYVVVLDPDTINGEASLSQPTFVHTPGQVVVDKIVAATLGVTQASVAASLTVPGPSVQATVTVDDVDLTGRL